MSAPALAPPDLAVELDLGFGFGFDEIRALVAVHAPEVDRNARPASWLLPELARRGLLRRGIDELLTDRRSSPDLTEVAQLIDTIAQEDLATAFSVWAHRMVLDYLARADQSPTISTQLDDLLAGRRIGSTAMASGVKALAGIDSLPVTASFDDGVVTLDGTIPWASNLSADGIVVVSAGRRDGAAVAIALPLDTPGITRRKARGLLSLEATWSGSLTLAGGRVGADAVISDDLAAFVGDFRPGFLILQSSFALGLARRALAEANHLDGRPDQNVLRPHLTTLTEVLGRHTATRDRLAIAPDAATARELVTLRLEVVDLAVAATRLEATLTGGRGFVAASPTSRRLREAAFLPIQSPSEGHLRWELSSLASTA